MFRIYATVYNNVDTVDRSVASLSGLKPYKLYVVDSFSSDGTYEKLSKYDNIVAKRARCTRGKGRDIALDMLLKEAKDSEPVMYVDLDTIYTRDYISVVLKQAKFLRHGELRMLFIGLSTAKTNRGLFWRDLNVGEDWERLARAKASSIEIVDSKKMWRMWRDRSERWLRNRSDAGFDYSNRERRYSSNNISHKIRMFKLLVDYERGVAFDNFDDYYDKAANKNPISYLYFKLTFAVAHVLGIYTYAKGVNNTDYVLGFRPTIRRRF